MLTCLCSVILYIIGSLEDPKPSSDPPCVIEKLCSLHDGLVLEAKGIKEHFWKPYIRKLFEKKVCKQWHKHAFWIKSWWRVI